MPLLHLTLFDSFVLSILAVFFFINAKILTRDWKLRLKEGIYIALSILVFVAVIILHISLRRAFPDITENMVTLAALNMSGSFILRSLLFIYFYRIRFYSVSKSLILMFLASMSVIGVEHLVGFVWHLFAPEFFTYHALWQLGLYVLSIGVISVLSTYVLAVAPKRLRSVITRNSRLQVALVCVFVFVLIAMQVVAIFWRYPGYTAVFVSWLALFMLISLIVSIVGFFLYAKILRQKLIIKQKENEQKVLQYYTEQIEKNQTAMRKFKHDYQNILISLSGFIQDENWSGLADYYVSKIEPAFEIITKDKFALENLSKIKLSEIKGILAAKLTMAQNLNIYTTFEADEEIDHIPMDSVALVRMLGIILDNAIEELETIGEGQLLVACFKVGTSVNFVVQNTCRPDIQPMRQLRQPGFTTKGKGAGIGLVNLSELADQHPNVTLVTTIAEGNFTQKLIIGEAV